MAKRQCIVYGIYHQDKPDEIRYIGQTVDLSGRKSCHRSRAKKGIKSPLYNWMRKHDGKFKYIILKSNAVWNETEIDLIQKYRNDDHSLLNLTDGGDGSLGVKQTQEWIDKVQNSRKGYRHSEETRLRMRNSQLGKKRPNQKKAPPISEQTRLKMRNSRLGKKMSEETKNKISLANTGKIIKNRKPFSEEYKKEQSQRMKEWWEKRKGVNCG